MDFVIVRPSYFSCGISKRISINFLIHYIMIIGAELDWLMLLIWDLDWFTADRLM